MLGDSFGAAIVEHFSKDQLKGFQASLENGHANGNVKIAPTLQTPTATLIIDDTRM